LAAGGVHDRAFLGRQELEQLDRSIGQGDGFSGVLGAPSNGPKS
jgi:hypothetical protein